MNDGIKIEPRLIPVPESISPQAQAFLRGSVREDGIPFNSLYPMPAPQDTEAWRNMQIAAAEHYARAWASQAEQAQARVTTLDVAGTVVHLAIPVETVHPHAAYIDLHGGALVFGGGQACRVSAQTQADLHGMRCYSVDYRMPPDSPYPAALDDCMAAYRHALAHHAPQNIVLGGRSAGGNLAAATVLRARDEGLPLPAALVLLSPELDLTESGDSFQTLRTVDVVLPNPLMPINRLYANGADLTHPYLSPLFGEFASGFPPTFLQSGTRDLFLSNTVRMHRALRQARIPVELHVFEAMPHGGFTGSPEDDELSAEVSRFVRQWLALTGSN